MNDLVQLLRAAAQERLTLLGEAANEIERLTYETQRLQALFVEAIAYVEDPRAREYLATRASGTASAPESAARQRGP
jgi:hypothetical protein